MVLHLPDFLPTLQSGTGRFILEPYSPADSGALADILAQDSIWSQGYGDGDHRPRGRAELLAYIERRYRGHRIFSVFTDEPVRQFVGTTGVTEVDAVSERAKIGRTVISPACWGMKVGQDTKIALLDWLIGCGAGRIEADVDPRNLRSLSSLTRFGFTVEGTRRRSVQRVDGSWRDIVVLSLLREEWPELRARALAALTADVLQAA